ncbi:MAG: thymidylate kinase [Chloroflexi bacterium HGW-Chloroflexi-1]|nr:MAG: thymidylate kinase [Chloroflexi bacterium HGW-Chloroflexi-1]
MHYYGTGDIPGFDRAELPGRLIVLEGTDGVGRSTQVALLHEWLETNGYAVTQTGLARSSLVGPGLTRAKQGHTLGDITLNLFYATDFADRLEKEIIPALRAGFVCLTDRYIYSIIARASVRGVDYQWLRDLFGFAIVPDAVFYLEADLEHLVPRVLAGDGFDYWESGTDVLRGDDIFENYRVYQEQLLAQFRKIGQEYNFICVDANQSVHEIFVDLRQQLMPILRGMRPTV